MISEIARYLFRFVLLLLVQVLVLNNIQLGGYINPYLYVLFILILPFDTPRWLLLILAFTMGLSVDIFSNTAGMHAAALTFMAYCRPFILSLLAPRDGYDKNASPNIKRYGISWFVTYSLLLVSFHHILLFFIEVFRFSEMLSTIWRIILSVLFTVALIIVSEFLTTKTKSVG